MTENLMSKSRTTEINDVSVLITGAYKKASLQSDTYLASLMLLIEEKSNMFTKAIRRIKARSNLAEKAGVRDKAYRSVFYLVNGFLHHPDPVVSGAAAKVDAVLARFGLSVTGESYATASSLIGSLLVDLADVKLQDSIAALSGCAELISALRTALNDFEFSRIAFQKEKGLQGLLPNATAIKMEMAELINGKLLVHLNAMEQINMEVYGLFAQTVAGIIATNNVVVKKRAKKPQAEPAEQ